MKKKSEKYKALKAVLDESYDSQWITNHLCIIDLLFYQNGILFGLWFVIPSEAISRFGLRFGRGLKTNSKTMCDLWFQFYDLMTRFMIP